MQTVIKKQNDRNNWLQVQVGRIAKTHFYFVAIFVASIIVYHGWKLITPDVVLQRWTMAAALLVVNTVVWSGAKLKANNQLYYKMLTFLLILGDILVSSILVYGERGMASRAVALFAVPICISAILVSRAALFATASICAAAYSLAAVRYFVVNFNEGYSSELYGVVGFYCAVFFLLAAVLSVIVKRSD